MKENRPKNDPLNFIQFLVAESRQPVEMYARIKSVYTHPAPTHVVVSNLEIFLTYVEFQRENCPFYNSEYRFITKLMLNGFPSGY